MKRAFLIGFACLFAGVCNAQLTNRKDLRFDLSKIGFVMDGHQICEDKGRMQDYPSEVMDQIVVAGPKSVPVLIEMLTDARIAKTEEPIICYWYGMTISDIAFCVLGDLFMDPDANKTTIRDVGWNEMLGPDDGLPAWEQLHRFTRTKGRKALREKWQKLWDENADQLIWDTRGKYFKLKGSE